MKVSEYLEKKRKEKKEMEENHEDTKQEEKIDHDLEKIKKEEERIKELKKELRKKHGSTVGRNWKKMDPWIRADIIQTIIVVVIIIIGFAAFTGMDSTNIEETTSISASSGNFLTNLLGISGASTTDVIDDTPKETIEPVIIKETNKEGVELEEEPVVDTDLPVFTMEAQKTNGDIIENGNSIPGSSPYTSYIIRLENTGEKSIECGGNKEAKETGVKSKWNKKTIESGNIEDFSWRVGAPMDEVTKVQVINKITCNLKGKSKTTEKIISFNVNFPK
jgi:hypothetical protein